MQSLVRIKTAGFDISGSRTLGEMQRLKDEDRLSEAVLPLEAVFQNYRKVHVMDADTDRLVINGNPFYNADAAQNECGSPVCVYSMDGRFVGIYEFVREKRMFYPQKIFL